MKNLFVLMIFAVLGFFFTPNLAKGEVLGNKLQHSEFVYDFAKHGGAAGAIDLAGVFKIPVGSIVTRAYYMVATTLTSSGSATVAVGNATTAAKYLAATAYDNAAFTVNTPAELTSGLPHYVSVANDGIFKMTIGTAALTAGKIKFVVESYKPK